MWPIVDMSEKDRATDTRNMRKKFAKDHACGSRNILADRQTHRQTYKKKRSSHEVRRVSPVYIVGSA